MSTFLPIPDSYFLYDTTNSPNSAPESVLAEQESYGAIGWYDYNRKYFGTKWDTDLDNLNLNEYADKDMAVITFRTETAWSMPDVFFARLTDKFHDLVIIVEGTEESNAYFCVTVFDKGEWWDYCDLTEEFNKKCEAYNKAREELEKQGKTEEEIDNEVGEYVEDMDIFEKLDLEYENAVEKVTWELPVAED